MTTVRFGLAELTSEAIKTVGEATSNEALKQFLGFPDNIVLRVVSDDGSVTNAPSNSYGLQDGDVLYIEAASADKG